MLVGVGGVGGLLFLFFVSSFREDLCSTEMFCMSFLVVKIQ